MDLASDDARSQKPLFDGSAQRVKADELHFAAHVAPMPEIAEEKVVHGQWAVDAAEPSG